MTLLTDEDWEYYSYYPPAWHRYFFDWDLHQEDLCQECNGFGKVDFSQFTKGTSCEFCEGTGLNCQDKREVILVKRKMHSLLKEEPSVATMKKIIAILEDDK